MLPARCWVGGRACNVQVRTAIPVASMRWMPNYAVCHPSFSSPATSPPPSGMFGCLGLVLNRADRSPTHPRLCPPGQHAHQSTIHRCHDRFSNFVKALPWYSSVREKLADPQYSGFFLRFDPKNSTPYNVPPCDTNFSPAKCSSFYHDQEQSPGHPRGDGDCRTAPCDCGAVPCGEYLQVPPRRSTPPTNG